MSVNDIYDAHRRAIVQTQKSKAQEIQDTYNQKNQRNYNEPDTTMVVKVDTWWDKFKSKLAKK